MYFGCHGNFSGYLCNIFKNCLYVFGSLHNKHRYCKKPYMFTHCHIIHVHLKGTYRRVVSLATIIKNGGKYCANKIRDYGQMTGFHANNDLVLCSPSEMDILHIPSLTLRLENHIGEIHVCTDG